MRCACGHARAAHEHYRPGSDCGACGLHRCRRYRPGGAFRRWLANAAATLFAARLGAAALRDHGRPPRFP